MQRRYIIFVLLFAAVVSTAAKANLETEIRECTPWLESELSDDSGLPFQKSTEDAPVWKPFIDTLAKCDSSCFPVNYHAWRNTGDRSCHNFGRALDVFGFKCSGKMYWADSPKFAQIVSCFRKTGMKVIHNSPDHYDHGHFSITCYGGTHWFDSEN